MKTVEQAVKNKIRGQQNLELFEEEGAFFGKREIDIQSYYGGSRRIFRI